MGCEARSVFRLLPVQLQGIADARPSVYKAVTLASIYQCSRYIEARAAAPIPTLPATRTLQE